MYCVLAHISPLRLLTGLEELDSCSSSEFFIRGMPVGAKNGLSYTTIAGEFLSIYERRSCSKAEFVQL